MKQYIITLLALGFVANSGICQDKPDLKDAKQRLSYSIGADIGGNFKRQEIEVDPKVLAIGLADALAGKTALTEAEIAGNADQVPN